jgi:hypothetical protein
MAKKTNNDVNDLQDIKNLLILQLIRDGAKAEEISIALKAGRVNPSNIRIDFPMKKITKKVNDGK